MKIYYKDLVCKLRKEVVSLTNQEERRCMGNTARTFKHLFDAKNKSYSDFSLRQKYRLQNTIIELTCPSQKNRLCVDLLESVGKAATTNKNMCISYKRACSSNFH